MNKGYVPIVKATGKEHLEDLVKKEVDDSAKLPQIDTEDYNNISANIQVLNKGIVDDKDLDQINVINSNQYWYK